jgi:hypothetical protein
MMRREGLRSTTASLFRRIMRLLFGRRRPGDPHAPYAGVPHPNRRGPHGRTSAVAVAEPDEPQAVVAVGRARKR